MQEIDNCVHELLNRIARMVRKLVLKICRDCAKVLDLGKSLTHRLEEINRQETQAAISSMRYWPKRQKV